MIRLLKIIACMCIRNESYYLPGFLDHIRDYVDSFCVLDDGSTDESLEILKSDEKVERIIELPVRKDIGYDERGNREAVVKASRNLGADWVICCDPDERFEERFLKKLRDLVKSLDKKAYSLQFRELWDGYRQFRDDGIWGNKKKFVLFPLQDEMTFEFPHQYHTYWHYRELDSCMSDLPYNLYHMKMIKKENRIMRAKLYNALDPNLEIQPIGYDYLVDEKDLHVSKIKFKNRYKYNSIPKELRAKI